MGNTHITHPRPGKQAESITTDEAYRRLALEGLLLTAPPSVVNGPGVAQATDTLSCSTGTWNGSPSAYAYQWQMDGVDNQGHSPTYVMTLGYVGHTMSCVVTATNAYGDAATRSNNVVVVGW